MGIKKAILNLRSSYVKREVRRMKFPEFKGGEKKRVKIIFAGLVQRVGFRYEAKLVAGRLGLTGTARNVSDGTVEVELQGTEERLDAFVAAMKNVSRIKIISVEIRNIPAVPDEEDFTIIS